MNKITTHYDNLGVTRNAQNEVIKGAYKALAQKFHPDRYPDKAEADRIMKIINEAYRVLSDPILRAEHDRWIIEQEKQNQSKAYNSNNSTIDEPNTSQSEPNVTKSTKNQKIIKDYEGNTLAYWFDKACYCVLILIGLVTKLGIIPLIIMLGAYSLTFYLMHKKQKVNVWLSLVISFVLAIIALIVIGYAIIKNFSSQQIEPITDVSSTPVSQVSSNDTHNQNPQIDTIQTANATPTSITSESVPVVPTNSNSTQGGITLYDTQNEYNQWIANLNQAWQQLQPSFRKFILEEQRAFNQKRENDCKQYSLTINGDGVEQEIVNLQCQIGRLKERTEFLHSNLYTTVTPPPPKQIEQQPQIPSEKVEPVAQSTQLNTETENTHVNPNKKAYDVAIVNLNEAWNSLKPEVREELRPEQRENNKNRETKCREFALTLDSSQEQQDSIRLACEIPIIEERTKYLKQKAVSIQKNEPIQLDVRGAG